MGSPIVYRSAAMARILTLAERVAATDASVLITGESGTGKTALAAMIHELSGRRRAPFVTVPCANLQPELFESELFGHEPGAHTDAVARRAGRVESAQGGTLFLDGIESLTAPLQAKLLRVVQERSFERLGGTDVVQVDVRFIASAGAGLAAEARAGRFREDLFYRLNVVHLDLPPLRERVEDVAPLASHFLRLHGVRHGAARGRLTTAARRLLKAHSWPGNVRELGNVIERAIIATGGGTLGPESLALGGGTPAQEAIRQGLEARWSLEALEVAYIKEVLTQTRGNKSRAAAILGSNRKTLLQKLKKAKA